MSICFGSQRPYSSPLQPNQPDKSHNNMLMSTKAPVEDVLSYARLSHSRSHEENFNVRKSCDRHQTESKKYFATKKSNNSPQSTSNDINTTAIDKNLLTQNQTVTSVQVCACECYLMKEFNTRVASLSSQNRRLHEKIQFLQAQLAQYKEDSEKVLTQTRDEKKELEEQLAKVQKQLSQANIRLAQAQSKLVHTNQQLTSVKREKDSLNSSYSQLQQKCPSQRSHLAASLAELQIIKEKLSPISLAQENQYNKPESMTDCTFFWQQRQKDGCHILTQRQRKQADHCKAILIPSVFKQEIKATLSKIIELEQRVSFRLTASPN